MRSIQDDTQTIAISAIPGRPVFWNISIIDHMIVRGIFLQSPPFNKNVEEAVVAYIFEIKPYILEIKQ